MTDSPNEEIAAIGRYILECVLRSETMSVRITRGFQGHFGFRDRPQTLQWYVSTQVKQRTVTKTGETLGTALERLLDALLVP